MRLGFDDDDDDYDGDDDDGDDDDGDDDALAMLIVIRRYAKTHR
ncbi:hypothetical protein N9L68_04705 [bacterium]|nr:hypothetical protein [bacterium]